MALTSRDQVIAAMCGPGSFTGHFYRGLSSVAGTPCSTFSSASVGNTFLPGVGAIPTGPGTCNASTPGALPMPVVQTAGNTLYLTAFNLWTFYSGLIVGVLDRAAETAGLAGNTTAAQTVGVTLPARVTDPGGYVAYLECYLAGGAATQVWTLNYTNTAGVSGRTGTLTHAQSPSTQFFYPFTLQAGDTGVSSVQSVQTATAGSGAGNFGIVLARPLFTLTLGAGGTNIQEAARRNHTLMLDIGTSPCLFFTSIGNTVSTVNGTYTVAEG